METGIIKFHHTELLTAKEGNKVFVALKPIVEGMGLDYNSQLEKVKTDDRFNYRVIPMVANDGKTREMGSLQLDQLAGFLYSINPNKVAPHLREKIIAFQKETFNVINDYWNKGYAIKEDGSPLWLISKALETMLTQQATILKMMEQNSAMSVKNEFVYIDRPSARLAHRRLSNEEKFIARVVKELEESEGLKQGELLERVGRYKNDKTALRWLHSYDGIYWRANVLNNTYSYSLIEEA